MSAHALFANFMWWTTMMKRNRLSQVKDIHTYIAIGLYELSAYSPRLKWNRAVDATNVSSANIIRRFPRHVSASSSSPPSHDNSFHSTHRRWLTNSVVCSSFGLAAVWRAALWCDIHACTTNRRRQPTRVESWLMDSMSRLRDALDSASVNEAIRSPGCCSQSPTLHTVH